MTARPLLLLDGPLDLLPLVAQEVSAEGWTIVRGWSLPPQPWDLGPRRLLCAGEVGDEKAASQALLCGVRGAGILAAVTADESVRRRFEEDLRHLGPVGRRRGVGRGSGPASVPEADSVGSPRSAGGLDEDQLRLLRLLAEGLSVPEAARTCLLSQRTAERRLAAARRTLGVSTTAEALLAVERPGQS